MEEEGRIPLIRARWVFCRFGNLCQSFLSFLRPMPPFFQHSLNPGYHSKNSIHWILNNMPHHWWHGYDSRCVVNKVLNSFSSSAWLSYIQTYHPFDYWQSVILTGYYYLLWTNLFKIVKSIKQIYWIFCLPL